MSEKMAANKKLQNLTIFDQILTRTLPSRASRGQNRVWAFEGYLGEHDPPT